MCKTYQLCPIVGASGFHILRRLRRFEAGAACCEFLSGLLAFKKSSGFVEGRERISKNTGKRCQEKGSEDAGEDAGELHCCFGRLFLRL